jgi:hypothetical protein
MKNVIALLTIFLLSYSLHSQTWTSVGTHGTRTDLLIGLGIDPPQFNPFSQTLVPAKQYVNGNIAIRLGGLVLANDFLAPTQLASFQLTPNGDFRLYSEGKISLDAQYSGGAEILGGLQLDYGNLSSATGFNITNVSSLGIGTNTPQVPLHLIGNAILEGDVTISGNLSFGSGSTAPLSLNSDLIIEHNRVGIGILSNNMPAGYRLFVKEGILTESVKVALSTTSDWADYVFEEDYELMPLEEVSAYIAENKHLPNVLSSEEMVEEGLDLAKMDAKLLEKIEELTLYLIELKEENEQLKERISNLEE